MFIYFILLDFYRSKELQLQNTTSIAVIFLLCNKVSVKPTHFQFLLKERSYSNYIQPCDGFLYDYNSVSVGTKLC